MIPEPTTVASRNAVPSASATPPQHSSVRKASSRRVPATSSAIEDPPLVAPGGGEPGALELGEVRRQRRGRDLQHLRDLAGRQPDRPLPHETAEHREPRRVGERAERLERVLCFYNSRMIEISRAVKPRSARPQALHSAWSRAGVSPPGAEGMASDPAPAIAVAGLSKRYGAVQAVEGLSFTVPAGSSTALLGANGAGKTTTIAMLLGLLMPSAGRIEMLGQDMLRHRYRVLGRINFSSPYVDLPLRLTVRQNLLVYADLYGIAGRHRRIAELAADLDLETFLDRPTARLSAGQKTRVMLAKALINRPELLLLDEPTA
jgi:ABC-type glutathione transport system ATPase component